MNVKLDSDAAIHVRMEASVIPLHAGCAVTSRRRRRAVDFGARRETIELGPGANPKRDLNASSRACATTTACQVLELRCAAHAIETLAIFLEESSHFLAPTTTVATRNTRIPGPFTQ